MRWEFEYHGRQVVKSPGRKIDWLKLKKERISFFLDVVKNGPSVTADRIIIMLRHQQSTSGCWAARDKGEVTESEGSIAIQTRLTMTSSSWRALLCLTIDEAGAFKSVRPRLIRDGWWRVKTEMKETIAAALQMSHQTMTDQSLAFFLCALDQRAQTHHAHEPWAESHYFSICWYHLAFSCSNDGDEWHFGKLLSCSIFCPCSIDC
jgi:hypothetical protein